MEGIAELLDRHRTSAFPASVVKGADYGEIDPVMIDADIFGWAAGVARGAPLDPPG